MINDKLSRDSIIRKQKVGGTIIMAKSKKELKSKNSQYFNNLHIHMRNVYIFWTIKWYQVEHKDLAVMEKIITATTSQVHNYLHIIVRKIAYLPIDLSFQPVFINPALEIHCVAFTETQFTFILRFKVIQCPGLWTRGRSAGRGRRFWRSVDWRRIEVVIWWSSALQQSQNGKEYTAFGIQNIQFATHTNTCIHTH